MEQLRGDIASSRPMLTKGCCKGNNYEQRFALDTFPADFYWRNILAKPCILLFTWQQDCNTREACRLLLVVKVVFVVFPTQQVVSALLGKLLDNRAIGLTAEDDAVARGLAEPASVRTVAD